MRSPRTPDNAPPQAPVLLVAYGTGPMSDAQLHLACQMANDLGGIVRVLHVLVPRCWRTIEDVLAYFRHQHTNYRQLLDRLEERQGRRLTRNEHRVIKQRVDQLVGMRYSLPWV